MEMQKSPEEEAAFAHRRRPWLLDFIELGNLGAAILFSQDSFPGAASHRKHRPMAERNQGCFRDPPLAIHRQSH